MNENEEGFQINKINEQRITSYALTSGKWTSMTKGNKHTHVNEKDTNQHYCIKYKILSTEESTILPMRKLRSSVVTPLW